MAHGFHLPWQVRGLLLDEEVDHAKRDYYLKGVHIVVGTPQLMAAAMAGPDPQPVVQHTKVVAGGRQVATLPGGGGRWALLPLLPLLPLLLQRALVAGGRRCGGRPAAGEGRHGWGPGSGQGSRGAGRHPAGQEGPRAVLYCLPNCFSCLLKCCMFHFLLSWFVSHSFPAVAVDEVDACFNEYPREMELIMEAACAGASCATPPPLPPATGGAEAAARGAAAEEPAAAEAAAAAAAAAADPQATGSSSSDAATSSSSGTTTSSGTGTSTPLHVRHKPTVVLVGATAGDGVISDAVQRGWLSEPVVVAVGGPMAVPSGLSHRYILAEEQRKAAVLCRQIRLDLQQ